MRNEGATYREIAKQMCCDHKAIYRIIKKEVYKTWS